MIAPAAVRRHNRSSVAKAKTAKGGRVAFESTDRQRAPEAVERFAKALVVAHKAVKFYPPSSTIPRESARDVLGHLRNLLRNQAEMRLQVTKDGLLYGGMEVLPDNQAFAAFTREFYGRSLSEIRFHAGAKEKEVLNFMRIMLEEPEEITAAGGFEQRLWDYQIDGITVREVSTKVLDADEDAYGDEETIVEGEPWPPPRERIDALIDSGQGASPRDHRILMRFTQNPKLVTRYLQDHAADGGHAAIAAIAARIASIARMAQHELSDEQPALLRSLAEGVMSLAPEIRQQVLTERLLGDARVDESVAGVLRQLQLGELCFALAQGVSDDPDTHDGVARALRNLALIGMGSKETVVEAAREAMAEAGLADDAIGSVMEKVSPSRLRVRSIRTAEDASVESAIRLLDLSPSGQVAGAEAFAALREEARAGITDGDITMTMIDLVLLEDSLSMVLELSEFALAAEAASALRRLLDDESLDHDSRPLVQSALRTLAGPAQMRQLSATMRVHRAGSPEHDACKRLLGALGEQTVEPLLEALADEPDMSARKALVELISEVAGENVALLGDRMLDPRWYFVRNVVAILGQSRSPDALQYLSKTLRHSDERVRRETIRAVSGIRDRLSEEMLVAALSDEDAQNVQLAARYLGTLGSRRAAPVLIAVARGEGRGNRTVGPQVEAIEALGRLGVADAIPTLEDLARQRGLIRTARAREIRTAAEAALAHLRRQQGGGSR
jgi:HEAT repeat protein